MRFRSATLLAAAAAALLLPLTVTPASAAGGGSSTPKGSSVSAGTSCPSSMKLWVPKSADTLATATRNLVPDTLPKARAAAADNPLLKRIAAAKPTWLTSLDCKVNKGVTHKPAPAAKTRTEAKSGSVTPASVTTDCQLLDCSANWSGYQRSTPDSGYDYFSDVSMTWTVPSPKIAGDRDLNDSIWPGIGQGTGTANSGDQLIQAGSGTSVDSYFFGWYHDTYVYPWVEIFPQEDEVQITNFPLSAGDKLLVDVTYEPGSPNRVQFLLCNMTRNKCGTVTQTIKGTSGSTAEWIAERHTSGGTYTSLNDFGALNVSGAGGTESNSSFTSGFYAGSSDTAIYMTDCARSQYLAKPGTIDSGGTFTDTWQNYGPEDPANCK